MTGVLIRMKLRVLRHSLRGRRAALVVVGAVFGLVAAVVTVLVSALPFDDPAVSADVVAALSLLWTAGWLAGPVMTGGGDETLRPEHFSLLPIPPGRLAVGLLGASFVGVPPVVTLVALAGLVAFAARLGGVAVAVAVVAVLLQLVVVVLLSRVATATLGAVLRSRRGRDLGVLLTALVGLSGFAVRFLIEDVGPMLTQQRSAAFSTVLHALPTGWGPVAVLAAARADWLLVAAGLVGLVALIAVLLVVWSALLVRRTTTVATTSTGVGRRARRRRAHRGVLPAGPVGAVAGKELRLWWRDVRRRVSLLSTLIVGAVATVLPPATGGDNGMLPFAGLFVVWFACLQAGNLYGFDGSAVWHTLVVPGAERADVRGRQLAWLIVVAPLAITLAVVSPVLSDRTGTYPWIFALLPALLGGGAGLLTLLSVYAAYPVQQRRDSNPFAAGGNPGCARGLLQLAMALLLAVAGLPAAVVVGAGELFHLAVLRWLGIVVGVVSGFGFAWWWGHLAQRRLAAKGPELLATVGKVL